MWNKQNKAKIRNVAHRQKQLRWIPFMKVRVGVLNSIINYMENNLHDSGAPLQVGALQMKSVKLCDSALRPLHLRDSNDVCENPLTI